MSRRNGGIYMADQNTLKQLKASGKLDAVEKLASSADAAALAKMLDQKQLKTAAKSQDPAVIRAVLQQVLSTDEGKRLARKVKATMDHG